MATSAAQSRMLNDGALKQELQRLRQTDNVTNWWYLAKVYLIIAAAVGGAVAFNQWQMASGISFWWNLPVAYAALVVVGASQHQFGGATHEATHYTLFRNKKLNELASDWLCMFPLFSSTYSFRIYHLGHHQFINDPELDPDFASLKMSGHWLNFPASKLRFLRMLAQQFLVWPLIKYTLARAKYNAVGGTNNPYAYTDRQFSKWPSRIGITFFVTFFPTMITASFLDARQVLTFAPLVAFAIATTMFLMIPEKRYFVTKLRPIISQRTTWISRVGYLTLLATALSWTQVLTAAPVWIYYYVWWIAPVFSTFPFFMMLRQVVQHGNGDRGWLTNTRTFLVNRFIRYAVFPFGMDFHLGHHMFSTVPHYRLPELHRFMQRYPEYADEGLVVEGYFLPTHKGEDRNPTVIEVLGPEYARSGEEVYIDNSAVEMCHEDQLKDATKRAA